MSDSFFSCFCLVFVFSSHVFLSQNTESMKTKLRILTSGESRSMIHGDGGGQVQEETGVNCPVRKQC